MSDSPPQAAPPAPGTGATIMRNSGWLLGANLVGKAFSVVFAAIAANQLRAEGYGLFNLVTASVVLWHVLLDLGYMTLLIERSSKDRSVLARHYDANLGLKLIQYPVGALLLVGFVLLINAPPEHYILYLLAYLAVVANTQSYLQRAVLSAMENFNPVARADVLERFLYFSLGLVALLVFESLTLFFVVTVVALFARSAMLEVTLRRQGIRGRWRLDWSYYRDFLPAALPHAMYTIALVLQARVDSLMLGAWADKAAVGHYNVALDKTAGLVMLGQMVTVAIAPTASRMFSADRDEYLRIFRRAFFLLPVIGAPAAVGIALTARGVTDLLHTPEYHDTWVALVLLAPSVLLRYWIYLYQSSLLAAGRIGLHVAAESIGLALKIGLNLWLIPSHGYIGVAASVFVADTVVLLLAAAFGRRVGLPFLPVSAAWQPLLAAALMGVAVWGASQVPVPGVGRFSPEITGLALEIPVGVVVYALLCLAFGVHRREPAIGRLLDGLLARLPFRRSPRVP